MPRAQKYRDVVRVLQTNGWILLRQGKGSHQIWQSPAGTDSVVLSRHQSVSPGVIGQLCKLLNDVPNKWR
ncbi:MAG: type II toxin-antitoxin system HicA family toxin [Micrococcales bacterium]|nr:type II toxin-antitoxin system HicA family toxin [Micrococcales bacterium]